MFTVYGDVYVSVLVDCEWSSWSEWSSCSVSCGSGMQRSSRSVVQHRQYGGRECEGHSHRSRECTGPDCGKNQKHNTKRNHVDFLCMCCLCCISILCVCCSVSRGRALEKEHVWVRACVWQRVCGHVQRWTAKLHWSEQALRGLRVWGRALSWRRGPVCDSSSLSVRGGGRHTARGVYANTHSF